MAHITNELMNSSNEFFFSLWPWDLELFFLYDPVIYTLMVGDQIIWLEVETLVRAFPEILKFSHLSDFSALQPVTIFPLPKFLLTCFQQKFLSTYLKIKI